MEKHIQKQGDILESIKQVDRNFSKDSASRKTREYLVERLDRLDKYWAEFQSVNDKLLAYEGVDHPYFNENQFEKTRRYFDSVRQKIASYSPKAATETIAENNQPGPSGMVYVTRPVTPEPPGAPIASPRQVTQSAVELLTLQRTNFRAFKRMTRSIKVEEINVKWELEDELKSIQSRWKAIDSLHLQIDNILQGSDPVYEDEFEYYEESYKAVKRALNQKLASTAHLQQATPQLEVPVFTGRYVQWPTFCDLFSESIHNNSLLTKSQKMQHLKGKLRGEAERIIQHLHISADNYDTAWELLNHRYNNPQVLFTKHIETFLSQSNVHKQTANEIKRLYDISMESIHAIQNLGIDISTWDPILVHLITKKLDSDTYADYKEARKSPRALPSLTELMSFLEGKFTALEPINIKEREIPSTPNRISYPTKIPFKPTYKHHISNTGKLPNREYQATATSSAWSCPYCHQSHILYKCTKFLRLKPDAKLKTVAKLQVCKNCLYKHYDNKCNATKTCKICQCEHNTILHDAFVTSESITPTSSASRDVSSTSAQVQHNLPTIKEHNVNYVAADDEEVLLTTLLMKAKAADGTYVKLRALLDQGSQISLISENAMKLLGLPRQQYQASVCGIGQGTKSSKGVVTLELTSIYDDYDFTTRALVIPRVVNNLPNTSFKRRHWEHLQHLQLADPDYNVSRTIDVLLDASVYRHIITGGLIKGPNNAPMAQQTKMGWILSGNVKTYNCHVVVNNVKELSQYWEMEEITDSYSSLTSDEKYCEGLYQSTTRRLEDGRYEVAIPMKPHFEKELGLSKTKAIAQFHNIEKKMLLNTEFGERYRQFMLEYEKLGHMKRVDNYNKISCYLPHHGVLKDDSTTTKLRTVFNASSKTSTGKSLNDLMERGPNLQKDLQDLILAWRQHKYVITADVEKMFRMILVREDDQHLQRIIWRPSPHEPLREYQLTTVTYGTKSAPYLAMRTLRQIALDNEMNGTSTKYPLAVEALQSSFYMDDLLEGGSNLDQVKDLQQQIIAILREAGMNIRKWSSNTPELIKNLPTESIDAPLQFKNLESKKTLGISWTPDTDTFTFQNKFEELTDDSQLTKRQLLSYISKIFDPLGWISPLTVRAKLLFQKTWSDDTNTWDDVLSDAMKEAWKQLKKDVHQYSLLYTFISVVLVAVVVYGIIRWRKARVTASSGTVMFQVTPEGAQRHISAFTDNSAVKVPGKPVPNIDKCTWVTPKAIPRSKSVQLDIPSVSDFE